MAAVVAVLAAATTSCDRPRLIAAGPIPLSKRPVVLRFAPPIPSARATWELCFEFYRPRDSHGASGIQATILDASGRRFPMREPARDRRGESLVCLVGPVAAEDGAPPVPDRLELVALTPMRIRSLRGGPVR